MHRRINWQQISTRHRIIQYIIIISQILEEEPIFLGERVIRSLSLPKLRLVANEKTFYRNDIFNFLILLAKYFAHTLANLNVWRYNARIA